ncbi:terminase [Mycolicibacterium sp. Y3]
MGKKPPAAPAAMKVAGRRLWNASVDAFDFDEHELALREACRTLDSLDDLQAAVDRDGVVVESPQGMKAHPALVEVRQQRITYARLIAQLGIPAGDEDKVGKPARRPARGVYGITGVAG